MAPVNPRHAKSVDLSPERTQLHRRTVSDGDVYRQSALGRDGVGAGAQWSPGGSTGGGDLESMTISDLVVGRPVPTPQLQSEATAGSNTMPTPALGHDSELGQHELTSRVNIGSAPLVRIIEDVDKILQERTFLRHKLHMLRTSRSRMQSSLDELGEALETLSPPGVSSEDLAFSATHVAQSAQQPEPKPAQGSTELGVDMHSNTTSPVALQIEKQSAPSDQPVRDFPKLLGEFNRDLEAFRQQEDDFVAALDSLSNREYRLNEKQKALFEDLKDPEKAKMMIHRIITDEPLELHKQESVRAASEIPSLVEQYFDRRGDVGVWLDRRDELAEAWAEGLAEREFIADRGDPLEVTAEVFNRNYENQQAYMDRELQLAREEAEELEKRCLDAGYNIDEYRTTRRSETASEPSETLMSHYPLITGPLATINMHPQPSQQRPDTQIHSWLSDLPFAVSAPPEEDVVPPSAPQTPIFHEAAPQPRPMILPLPEAELPLLVAVQEAGPDVSIVEQPEQGNQASGPLAAPEASPARHLTLSPTQWSPSVEDHSPGHSLSMYTVAETALTASTTPPRSLEEVRMQPGQPLPESEGAERCAPVDPG